MVYSDTEVWLGIGLLLLWTAAAVLLARPQGRRWAGSRRWPAPVLIGTGVASVLFTTQALVVDSVADSGYLARLDGPVLALFVNGRSPLPTAVMEGASAYGGTTGTTVLAVLAAAGLWFLRRRREAVVVLAAAAGAGLLISGFKNLYERARPPLSVQLVPEYNYSLPSGHSLGSIVVLGVVAAAIWSTTRSVVVRTATVLLSAGGVALIGVSRLYLGVHWMTDVLTGWLLGGTWLALCMTCIYLPARSRPRRHPTGDTTALPPAPIVQA